MNFTTRNASKLVILVLVISINLVAAAAIAQTAQGTPSDLQFEVINATTGQPTSIERMTIDYVRERRNGIIDFEPVGSTFIAPAVPIVDGGEYLVTVWYQGIPYWWSERGHQLLDQNNVLHVFETTQDLTDVVIEGMNIVLRQESDLLKIEMMLTVQNTQSPQVTVYNPSGTFELKIPSAADHIVANYSRGPGPTPIEVNRGNARLELMAPLTPGLNSIRIEASVPWQDGMTLPVASDIAIQSWSVLTSPTWLVILSNDMHQETSSNLPGYTRWTGSQLDSGRQLDLRLTAGPNGPGEAEDLFTEAIDDALAKEGERGEEVEEKEGGSSLPLVFGGAMIIILGVVAFRRKMS
ncbi:MAG: hypothetical protein ACI9UK_000329 [Candidatus Krumholzibacteriia bacterium]|jgi:hypothetical protein